MRRADWVSRMWSAIEAAKSFSFAYGVHDCCLFAARIVDEMCETDYEAQLIQSYQDEETAMTFLASRGGLEEAVTSVLGIGPSVPILARRGDVCLVETQRGMGIGVSVGTTIAVASDGVAFYPISAALKCWRVD